jgi:succinate dehydrogenase / fumarate reductase iron-sulfur subunit
MQVQLRILRQNQTNAAYFQSYVLEVEPSRTILDCLNQIKWEQDGSLAFRKNCRNTICGSCAIGINQRSALACKESVGSELARSKNIATISANPLPEITLTPMGNMPVIKDLVVDMQSFWTTLKAVDPYVRTTARQVVDRESCQTPIERSRLNQMGNCILCGACYSQCNAREVDPSFVGPHALAKASRMVADTRDQTTEARLEKLAEGTQGVWGCTRCYYCNAVCPMDVAPMDQIGQIKREILQRQDDQASRSVRHRKVLIDLVKQGGWIDERQFGLKVVGNTFRDLQGLLSLAPLGLRLIAKGKFPAQFEPSAGTLEVRSLIESVQNLKADSFEQVAETPEPIGG